MRRVGFVVVLSWLLAACSAAPAPEPPSSSDEANVEVIRPPVLRPEARAPQADGRLEDVEVYDDRLVFHYSAAPAEAPAVGQVVAGVHSGGYLRRILTVDSPSPRVFELGTEHAFLTDYFEDLHVRVTFEPEAGSWVERGTEGRRSDALGGSIDLIKNELAPGCSAASGLVEVGADFRPRFEMDLDIGWRRGTTFHFEVGGNLRVFTKMSTGEASLSCMWDRRFESLEREFSTTFFVGFVPVVVTHTLAPRGAFSLGGEVMVPRAEFEASATIDFNAGAHYEDGSWEPLNSASRSGAGQFSIEEGGGVSITSRLTAGIDYQTKLYDLAGPQMTLGPYLEAHAESDLCEWTANADVGMQMTIGARLDIPVFDISLVDYSTDAYDLVSGTFWEREGTWAWCEDDDPCSVHTDCGACNSAEGTGCGWCAGSNTCMRDGRQGECSGDWYDSPSSCVDCSGYTACDSCVRDGFCGWCPGVGCLNDRTPEAEMCDGYQLTMCR